MKYIDAIKGSVISLILFIGLVIYVEGIGPTPIIETILTVSTFLFAILTGFFLSRLNSRYNKIRKFISEEDAYFFSLYKTSKLYGKKLADSIANKIDDYYIVSFDSDLANYYKKTAHCLEEIYEEIYKIKKKSGESSYANMFSILLSIELVRNKNAVIAKEKLTKSQWTILICLTTIILACLFYLNTNQIFFEFLLVLIATILVLVLLTIRDLQNLRLGGKVVPILESGQEVLESMGKLRYYNQILIEEDYMEIPEHVTKYRLGLHKPGKKPKIKIIGK